MEENSYFSLRDLLKKDEIYLSDFYAVIKFVIVQNLKLFFGVAITISTIATLYYFSVPVEFESKSVVYIETVKPSGPSDNMMRDLIMGNLPSKNSNSISPDKYKSIISSKVFLNELIDVRLPKNKNSKDSISLSEYFLENPTKDFIERIYFSDKKRSVPAKISKTTENNKSVLSSLNRDIVFSNQIPPIVEFDNSRLQVFSNLEKRIRIEVKDNTVSVFVKMPTPYLSAIVGKLVLERLLIYVSSLGTFKQKSDIEYLSQRLYEAEANYKLAQQKYAGYKDNSLGVIFESAQTNSQLLSNNLTIAFNVYNQLAVQYEQAKLELKKETPYFSILEPISIPSAPIEPSLIKFIIFTIGIIVFVIFIIILFKTIR
jgi:hypothetical protein